MKAKLKRILLLCLFTGIMFAGFVTHGYREFLATPFTVNEDGMHIVIDRGMSFRAVSRELAERGVISNAHYLDWAARMSDTARRVKAGEYRLDKKMLPDDFLDMIVDGKVVQYSFTIIDGWNIHQLLAELKESPHLVQTLPDTNAKQLMGIIGHDGEKHAEGWFFPDTYYFPRGTTDVMLLQRAHNAMHEQLDEAWSDREEGLPYKTAYQALIMASIIEKETARADERQQISGVFVRRLRKGMKLQTDPTVIYGIKDYDGNIRRRDLKKDTPYNTYTRKGLPPTPIAMPGRAAIDAALHPEEGDALFFVSRGDGSHVFSATLAEHNEAVIKYQLNGRRKSFSSHKENK